MSSGHEYYLKRKNKTIINDQTRDTKLINAAQQQVRMEKILLKRGVNLITIF